MASSGSNDQLPVRDGCAQMEGRGRTLRTSGQFDWSLTWFEKQASVSSVACRRSLISTYMANAVRARCATAGEATWCMARGAGAIPAPGQGLERTRLMPCHCINRLDDQSVGNQKPETAVGHRTGCAQKQRPFSYDLLSRLLFEVLYRALALVVVP